MIANEPDDEKPRAFASPPCFLHELDPAFTMQTTIVDVMQWRKSERERLIAKRMTTSVEQRLVNTGKIAAELDKFIGDVQGLTVSVYWPFRGEPDLRTWMDNISQRGGHSALPVVIERGQPLVFRRWKTGEPLARGIWNIPIPAAGADVVPDIVIAPVVGFDSQCYRLGYGGGFFDRTLAALKTKPRIIGVGYQLSFIPTIHPQPHDIAMDVVVTELGVQGPD